MIEQFYPDEWLDSAYVIDYEKLYKEGCRGLIFDIDNTLVAYDEEYPNQSVIDFVDKSDRVIFEIFATSDHNPADEKYL